MSAVAWLTLLVLLALNALYVAGEFSAVGVRRGRIRQQAEAGNAAARRLLPVLEDPRRLDRYIAACQIGITLSSLGLGAYGQARLGAWLEPAFARWGGEAAAAASSAAVVLVVLTVLQMVLAELVPKSLALQYPTRTALLSARPVGWSETLLRPFIWTLNGSGLLLLRLLGLRQAAHQHIHSPDEIELLIAESRDGGLLRPDEHRRLRQGLRLSTRPSRQLMVPRGRVVGVPLDTSWDELLRMVREAPYTRLPVYRGDIDHIVGVVHSKDVGVAAVRHSPPAGVEALLRPILSIPENLPADRLLGRLREGRNQMAVVVDEYGGTAGIVTLEDVLSELVGEAGDEFRPSDPAPETLPDGRVRLPGAMRMDRAARWIGTPAAGNADTLAGWVAEELGTVPEQGARISTAHGEVEVERVVNRVVQSVLVTPAPEESDNE